MKILKRTLDNSQTKKNYKKAAWFYNAWSKLTESEAADKVIELSDIKSGDHIIEIACGTGLVFKEILRRNPNGQNLGIDLSEVMLSRAKNLLKNENPEHYKLRQGDVFDLNINNETYDKLVNNFMIDLMPEEKFDEILREFYRILKPNGTAVISI